MTTSLEAFIRRAADIALSAGALLVLSPVLGAIAIRVKRESSGPVVVRQTRVGRFGRPFTIYKFRTMYSGSTGLPVTAASDPRVTRVGRQLRQRKLDELPQLFNVLKGDMSLAGPRPEVPEFVRLWPARTQRIVLAVRPGITDPITLAHRDEEHDLGQVADPREYYTKVLIPAKTRGYEHYLSTRSLPGDVAMIGRTLAAVVRQQ